MTKKKIRVLWSNEAKADLKEIYEWIKETTESVKDATTTRTDIINASKQIVYIEQYQVEELLGEPYRRMVVRHYKIVYRPDSDNQIRILKIFDTHKSPNKIKNIKS
jgi:plasmid stabilization system protein ParE